MEPNEKNIDAHTALKEIQRLERKVRVGTRFTGWLWIVIGISAAVFGVFAPPVTSGWAEYVVTIGFPIAGLLCLVYAFKQQVISQTHQRMEYPITWIFCGLIMVDSIFRMATHPTQLSAWVIILGVLPAIPCWYGAVRVWHP